RCSPAVVRSRSHSPGRATSTTSARGCSSTSPKAGRSRAPGDGWASTDSPARRRCLRPPTRTRISATVDRRRPRTRAGAGGRSFSTSAAAGSPTSRRTLESLGETLELVVRLDPLEREHHRGGAHVDLLPDRVPRAVVRRRPARHVAGDVADDAVVRLDRLLETAVHLRLAPVLHALVLDPLVVADGDAAGVADDVRDQLDPALRHDAVALRSGRTVRPFRDQLALEPFGDGAGDLASQRRRDADVSLDVEEVGPGDLLGLGISADGAPQVARIVVDVRDEIVRVDAGGIEDGAARVVDCQQPGAEAAEDLRGIRSDVSESLEDEGAAGGCGAALRKPFLDAVREPLSGGPHTPLRSADARVLAGDHAAQLVPLAFAIGVLAEQQAHDGAVSADVRGGGVQ